MLRPPPDFLASASPARPNGPVATKQNSREGGTICFLRKRDYVFVCELGRGACGETILLHDDQIDEQFVCKKYTPYSEAERQTLFANFVREIKLLHKLHHQNVVRVFNYYLYPDQFTGYILMEYVDGTEIDDYLARRPDQTNDVFVQSMAGFAYLERVGILHRDIRPGNLMVTQDGLVKIIDFGFGKQIKGSEDFRKSVSLNWWCQPPQEFQHGRYDFASEVYFLGKLFEQIIKTNHIQNFKYAPTLAKMCCADPATRIKTFAEAEKTIGSKQFPELDFTAQALGAYRAFAKAVSEHLKNIESGTKYVEDVQKIRSQLGEKYRGFMLEQIVPDPSEVIFCILTGTYYYNKTFEIPVPVVRDFLRLLATCSEEQGRIIVANLQTKLDAIPRYTKPPEGDDDVPF